MKNDETKRIGVLTVLSVLIITSLILMNRFDFGLYKNLRSDSDIVSCIYSEINSVRGSHYWIDLKLTEDGSDALINVHNLNSEVSEENVQYYKASPDVMKVTAQIIDLNNMKTWKSHLNGDFPEHFSASSVLIRYSDGSTLYLNDQNLDDARKEIITEIKKSILNYTVNSNSRLSLEKITDNSSINSGALMSLRVEYLENGYLTVYVTNHSGVADNYNTDFILEKYEKGSWHELERLSDYDTEEPIDIFINDMQVLPHTLDLNAFGTLRRGHYRITLRDDITTEFNMK